jgi:hypothetical protein
MSGIGYDLSNGNYLTITGQVASTDDQSANIQKEGYPLNTFAGLGKTDIVMCPVNCMLIPFSIYFWCTMSQPVTFGGDVIIDWDNGNQYSNLGILATGDVNSAFMQASFYLGGAATDGLIPNVLNSNLGFNFNVQAPFHTRLNYLFTYQIFQF